MSAKPSSTYQWATSGPITPPTSGKQTAGFAPGERGAAQYFDWLLNGYGQWAQYLNDGVMSGAFTFDTTVGITGLLTATAGVTVGANNHVTISGTGKYKRGTRIRHIPAIGGIISGAGTFQIASNDFVGGWKATATNDLLAIPITLADDERITEVKAVVRGDSTATCNMALFKNPNTPSSASSSIANANTTASNTDQTLDLAGLTEVGGALFNYYVRFKVSGAVASALWVNGIDVYTDVP